MKILVCDTSGTSRSCALNVDGQILASSFLSAGTTHSQTFMPMLDELMKRAQCDYYELDAYACTVGPGSFTGIRIGVSTTKAMAYATKKPAIPVSSLHALAFPLLVQENVLIAPMIDARNHRAFASAYFNGKQVIKEQAQDISEFINICDRWRDENAPGAHIITCGNAGHKYNDPDDYEQDRNDVINSIMHTQIDPAAVAFIAFEKIVTALAPTDDDLFETMMALSAPDDHQEHHKEIITGTDPLSVYDPAALMPTYLARTAAERNKEKEFDK